MKDNIPLIGKLNSMSMVDIRKMVQDKSEYGTYSFKYEGNAQKSYYIIQLSKYKLFAGNNTSTSESNGLIIYSPREIKRTNNRDPLPGYKIYAAASDFISSGKFESMYYQDDVCEQTIENSEFDIWLTKYLVSIFGVIATSLYQPKKFIYENMKTVKKYDDFLNEKKIPKITIGIENLLSVLDKNKADVFREFLVNKDEVGVRGDIEQFYTNNGFNRNMKKNGLKHGKLQNTQYSETLLDEKYVLKFFFVYDKGSMELEEPKFIILQYYNTETKDRSDILGFTNSDNINSFYEKLTDATVELSKGDDTYVYQTSNGGNNWSMKNVQMEDDEMKGTLDKKELQSLIDKKKLNVTHD